jgi:hypothetical protein
MNVNVHPHGALELLVEADAFAGKIIKYLWNPLNFDFC